LLEDCYLWEYLHDQHLLAHMEPEAILDLAKSAGYPESEAQKLASEYAWQRLKAQG